MPCNTCYAFKFHAFVCIDVGLLHLCRCCAVRCSLLGSMLPYPPLLLLCCYRSCHVVVSPAAAGRLLCYNLPCNTAPSPTTVAVLQLVLSCCCISYCCCCAAIDPVVLLYLLLLLACCCAVICLVVLRHLLLYCAQPAAATVASCRAAALSVAARCVSSFVIPSCAMPSCYLC